MRYFLFSICLFPFWLNAQSFIDFEFKDGKTTCECKNDNTFLQNTLDTLNVTKDERFLGCCYYCIGRYYYKNGEDLKAIQYYKKGIEIRKKYDDNLLWKSYRNIGYAYVEGAYYAEGVQAILKGFEINNTFKKSSTAYKYLGRCYVELGEYEKAVVALESAVKFAKSNYQLAEANNSLCYTLIETEDSLNLTKALQYAKKAIELFEEEEDVESVAAVYTNKGNAHDWLSQHETAIQSYNKAKQIYVQKQDTLNLAKNLNNIATTLYAQGKYNEAIIELNKSLKLKKRYYNSDTFQYTYAANYENLAENYEALENKKEALKNYQLALINLTNNFRNQDPNINPTVIGNHYIYNKPDLLRVLDLKAQAALKSGNINLAHDTYKVLDEWINEFYKDLSTKASKLTWIDRAHDTYAHAIEVALAKGDDKKAFEYAEKAHAVLLWQSLSQQAAQNLLSENEREKMDDLNAKIRQADQQYRYGEIKIDALRTLERERDNLEKTFDEKYEAYAQRKYQAEATTVSDIQSKIINDNTAFIEYYRTDEVLYIFTITKNGLDITQKNADGLANDITNFVKNISRKNMDVENYHLLAHKLYEQLIPSAIHSNDNIKHLVIVPDREIGTLPFAALTTEVSSGALSKNTPFFVKKYTTNYLYSAASYLQLQQKPANQKYCFAGIAPVEYQMEKWKKNPLPFSEQELEGMKPLHWSWQREILKREAATKAEFERIIQEGYRTIQVSTHAVFDKNKGQIIFHDSALNQDEIDQLEINTHRLILSACETGIGTQNQGEGILSLGWNFAYKGVPSITMTHWSVSDNSTKNIMIHYHQQLNDSIPADQALQIAQQHYLENTISDTQAKPHYWAAFFHTGNTE